MLAPQFKSGRNSQELHVSKTHDNPIISEKDSICSPVASDLALADTEPVQPDMVGDTLTGLNNTHNTIFHQDQLRIQHNETLPPPGPSASSNQYTGKVANNQN